MELKKELLKLNEGKDEGKDEWMDMEGEEEVEIDEEEMDDN